MCVKRRLLQDMSLEEQDDYFNDIDEREKEGQLKVLKEIIEKASSKSNNIRKYKEKGLKFKCRLCGCDNYQGIYGGSDLIPLCGKRYPIAYQCENCSVIFKDDEKFTLID